MTSSETGPDGADADQQNDTNTSTPVWTSMARAKNKLLQERAAARTGAADIAVLFKNMHVDDGTRLQSVSYAMWNTLPVRIETWIWEGIFAVSAIFLTKDVAELDDEMLQQMARMRQGAYGSFTIERQEQYTFVNHSFEVL